MSKPGISREDIVGRVNPGPAQTDGKAAELQAMKDALRALRPGEDIHLDKSLPPVHLDEIKVGQVLRFSEAIGNALPQIQRNLNMAKLTANDFKTNGAQVIGAVLPVVAKEFGDLIDECVSPRIFKELPPDLAAPIISKWIEQNILDPGKLEAWKTAFAPILGRLKGMVKEVPADGAGADQTSETSAAS